MKVKRDRIFVITLGLVLANLAYWFSIYLSVIGANWTSASYWALLLADLFAIVGVLWLLRSYRQGRKEAKREQEAREAENKLT
jgi:type VI protein secretion system component VasK